MFLARPFRGRHSPIHRKISRHALVVAAALGLITAGGGVSLAHPPGSAPVAPLPSKKGQAKPAAPRPKNAPPAAGETAPNFSLREVSVAAAGKPKSDAPIERRLDSLTAGRPSVLFFFCGCSRCQEVAIQWAQLQSGSPLGMSAAADLHFAKTAPPLATANRTTPEGGSVPAGASVVTIMVFQGSEDEVRSLAAHSGLDASEATTFLLDKDGAVSRALYRSEPCPRAYVLDGKRRIRHVNDSKEDDRGTSSPVAITASALSALRGLVTESLAVSTDFGSR